MIASSCCQFHSARGVSRFYGLCIQVRCRQHRNRVVLQEGLAVMAVVQRKWTYLEPIFSRGALPSHASQFRQVTAFPPHVSFYTSACYICAVCFIVHMHMWLPTSSPEPMLCNSTIGMLTLDVQVDDAFRGVLASIAADPLLRSFSQVPGIESKLSTMLTQLDACQAALLDFLEAKRSVFPRWATTVH